ncbi:hypothetical protein SIL79_15535 [Shewanella indica]|uniref:Uncharacterized protein n=1 Tax=Shewanella indica TaxID=768528 RepID=A0ABU4QGJ2_9GAMM|nr:hypothetical protein [Shewanella indica]MDX6017723.1 hypothetical protein [Shewanella indica]
MTKPTFDMEAAIEALRAGKDLTGVVDQIIRLNATAPRLSAALRDFLANRHTQSYDFV